MPPSLQATSTPLYTRSPSSIYAIAQFLLDAATINNTPLPTQPNPQNLVTATRLATTLGVTPCTIYRWAKRGRIPCLRLGRKLRFDSNAVIRSLQQSTQEVNHHALQATQQTGRLAGAMRPRVGAPPRMCAIWPTFWGSCV